MSSSVDKELRIQLYLNKPHIMAYWCGRLMKWPAGWMRLLKESLYHYSELQAFHTDARDYKMCPR